MSRELEDRIEALAICQHGVVTRGQLLQAGLSSSALGRRLKSGRLRALHAGVYVVGPLMAGMAGKLPADLAAKMAAVLAGGPGALLSHADALALWGMGPTTAGGVTVHVTTPGSGRANRPGIHFHRARRLADDERAVVRGIPVTGAGRTLVDAAGMLGRGEIERAVAVAQRKDLIPGDELAGLPDRYAGRRGMAMLRAVVCDPAGPPFFRSELERRCFEMFAEAGLPRPRVNVVVGAYELDFFFPEERVAIEVDGRAHHAGARFEGDRSRDTWLSAQGIQVVRLSWRQVVRERMSTAVQVGQILVLARARAKDRGAAG